MRYILLSCLILAGCFCRDVKADVALKNDVVYAYYEVKLMAMTGEFDPCNH